MHHHPPPLHSSLTCGVCLFCPRRLQNLWTAPMSDEMQPSQSSFSSKLLQLLVALGDATRCILNRHQPAASGKQQAVGGRQGWQSQRRHFIRAGRAKKLIDPWSATEWGRQAGPAWIPCSLQPAALPGRRELALWRHHRKGGVAVSRSTRALKQFKIPKRRKPSEVLHSGARVEWIN